MTNRIIEIAEGPVRLRIELNQLVIEKKEEPVRTVPLEDVAILICATTQASYTHSVFSECAKLNIPIVLCGERSLPVATASALMANTLHAQILKDQISADASKPLRKQIWRQIIIAKIHAQSDVLINLDGDDGGLKWLASRVRSGDASNVEAQAARLYWPRLFRDESFRRAPGEPIPPNHLLDYGYAVLRAIVARAIVGTGLHPALGIHHHHRENGFALADDLMEPFRPLVDEAVARMVRAEGPDLILSRERKKALLTPLLGRFRYQEEQRSLFDILSRVTANLLRVMRREEKRIEFPVLRCLN